MYQNLNKNCHWQCNITKVVKGQRCWEGTGQKEHTELLGNQGPLPDALQVGRFDAEVQPRKSSFMRRPGQDSEGKSHFRLPRGRGVWDIYGTSRRASGLGKGGGRQGRGAVSDVLRRRKGVPRLHIHKRGCCVIWGWSQQAGGGACAQARVQRPWSQPACAGSRLVGADCGFLGSTEAVWSWEGTQLRRGKRRERRP